MRKVELLPTRDCEAGYGPAGLDPPELLSLMQDRTLWRKFIMASDRGRRR